MVNYMICNCKQVSRFDVEEALEKCQKFEDVEKTFQEVQAITHCSTGCGGCPMKATCSKSSETEGCQHD